MRHPARSHATLWTTGLILSVLLYGFANAQAQKISAQTPLDSLKAYCAGGNTEAMIELGQRLLHGKGMTVDTTQGIAMLQKAAEAGNSQAWYALGVAYADNQGVQTDMSRAMTFFRKGAAQKNADCQASLGLFYQAGERIPSGVKTDLAEARKWYLLAAEQGHEEAIMHLGQLLISGQGGQADPAEGAKWFRKGAELGSAESQWSLAQCYLQGKGVAKDSVQAYGLMAAAADGAENPEMKKGMGERCDALGKTFSQQQLKKGNELATEWKAKRK